MLVRNIVGYVGSFDLDIEVENEQTYSVNAWLACGPNFVIVRPPWGAGQITRRAQPPPLPPPLAMSEPMNDEDFLDAQSDDRAKDTDNSGCNESDPRDGRFTDDSDSYHDHFMNAMQHMINRGGAHGDSSKSKPKKQKIANAPSLSRNNESKTRSRN